MTTGRSDMSSQIEDELRIAFEAGSNFVQPRPALADRVRRAVRRRRARTSAALAAATACVLVAAGGAYAALHNRPPASVADSQLHGRVLVTFTHGEQATALFASGKYLYSEYGGSTKAGGLIGPFTLAAYNRFSGRLIRKITVPLEYGTGTMAGPGGSVWMVAGPFGRPVTLRLYSPDLRLRSIGPYVQSTLMVPVGPTTALVPVARGLLEIRINPIDGSHWTDHLLPGTGLGRGAMITGLGWAVGLDGRVAVNLPDNRAHDYYVVIAGHPSLRYTNHNSEQGAAVAGDSLWLATGYNGPLVRLNSQLKPTTPGFVTGDPVLQKVMDVWSADGTVWVATQKAGHSLVCFAANSQDGPVVTVAVHGFVHGLADVGRTVYVESTRTLTGNPRTITSYPVPAACR
jgi:hypothetical protein